MKVIFVFLLCSASTVLGQNCGDSSCSSTECCLHPTDGDPYCQALGAEGEECQPSGVTKVTSCQCSSGNFCTMTNRDDTDHGVCMSRANTGPQCGNIYCQNNHCCRRPFNQTAFCQPYVGEGEVCETLTSYHSCPCNNSRDICIPRTEENLQNHTGVCIDQDNWGEQCGRLYCTREECCLEPGLIFYNGPPRCAPLAQMGELCIPRGFNITLACPCAEGLNCTFSAALPNSAMQVDAGICGYSFNYGNYMQGFNGGINGGAGM